MPSKLNTKPKPTADGWQKRGPALKAEPETVMKPMRDDVLVELLDAPPTDILIIPDAYKDTPVRGKVLATGPGRVASTGKLIPCDVVPGEVIQFHFGAIMAYYPDRKHAVVEGPMIQAVIG